MADRFADRSLDFQKVNQTSPQLQAAGCRSFLRSRSIPELDRTPISVSARAINHPFFERNLLPDTTFRAAVVTLSTWSVQCTTVSASPSIATCQDGVFPTHLPCKARPTVIRICQPVRVPHRHRPAKSTTQRPPLHRWLVRHHSQSGLCGRPCGFISTQCAQPEMATHACPAIFRRQGIWHV